MEVNYHSHTKICNHAKNTVEEVIELAILQGFKTWGFSEHIPYTKNIDERRTSMKDFLTMIEKLLVLREEYKDKIEILIGVECEAIISEKEWYWQLRANPKIDYFIFGNHYEATKKIHDRLIRLKWETDKFYYGFSINDSHLDAYCQDLLRGIDWGIYDYIAHPDVFMKEFPKWNEKCIEISHKICKAAAKAKLPLGFNINGIHAGKKKIHNQVRIVYPIKEFWDIAKEYNCQIILELDSHDEQIFTNGSIEKAKKMAKDWEIKFIEKLKLK